MPKELTIVLNHYRCFHVILTDSEEIASYAFATLKQYLEIYESRQYESRPEPNNLVNLVSHTFLSAKFLATTKSTPRAIL